MQQFEAQIRESYAESGDAIDLWDWQGCALRCGLPMLPRYELHAILKRVTAQCPDPVNSPYFKAYGRG